VKQLAVVTAKQFQQLELSPFVLMEVQQAFVAQLLDSLNTLFQQLVACQIA
jgi:hypothetical protein